MKVMPGISIIGIQPETVFGMTVVREVYRGLGEELVFTCITDGVHIPKSLHYVGYAFDTRTSNFNLNTVEDLATACREKLGLEWDVVVESDHIHFEFQPKANRRS